MRQASLLPPLVTFDAVDIVTANACLSDWGHAMGPIVRRLQDDHAYGLFHHGCIAAIVVHSSLIRERVAGLERHEAIELSRLCACRPTLCRVALRLWREFVFPCLAQRWAVTYQDTALYSGNLYRFDGWVRIGRSRSGTDPRNGRQGRSKAIWGWHTDPAERAQRAALAAWRPQSVETLVARGTA